MLFLLNNDIVELSVPEAHLGARWRAMGCGNPHELRAQDAIDFVRDRVSHALGSGRNLTESELKDFAALIITKTGANSIVLTPRADGSLDPRLQDVPRLVLETYKRGADNENADTASRIEA